MTVKNLENTLSTHLINTASCIYSGNPMYHPVVITNAVKNILGDTRSNPSNNLLEFIDKHYQPFEKRSNDNIYLQNIDKKEIGLTAFISDLEDACQNADKANAQKHLARIYLASDGSPVILQNLAELGLQNIEENGSFIYHCLRAFAFAPEKERIWIFLQCVLHVLFNKKLPKPHKSVNIESLDINMFIINSNSPKELNTLASVWRLWESDYTRLPGFKREISFWANKYYNEQEINTNEQNPDALNNYLNNQNDYFVLLAEEIIQSNIEIDERLITLESLRYFTKRVDIKYLPAVAHKINSLMKI